MERVARTCGLPAKLSAGAAIPFSGAFQNSRLEQSRRRFSSANKPARFPGLSVAGRALWSCKRGSKGNGRNGRNLGHGVTRTSPICNANYGARMEDEKNVSEEYVYKPDPSWLWFFKSTFRCGREVLEFLWEQPGQLKYIEFTPLDSMVKMAFLTLGVVVLLTIFLATVDSTFSYILATILRKVP